MGPSKQADGARRELEARHSRNSWFARTELPVPRSQQRYGQALGSRLRSRSVEDCHLASAGKHLKIIGSQEELISKRTTTATWVAAAETDVSRLEEQLAPVSKMLASLTTADAA
ncbi:hypothetical protein MRX96_026618 [Rhipicephalus microplus]